MNLDMIIKRQFKNIDFDHWWIDGFRIELIYQMYIVDC